MTWYIYSNRRTMIGSGALWTAISSGAACHDIQQSVKPRPIVPRSPRHHSAKLLQGVEIVQRIGFQQNQISTGPFCNDPDRYLSVPSISS